MEPARRCARGSGSDPARIGLLLLPLLLLACPASTSEGGADADASADHAPDARGWGRAAGLRYLEVLRGGARRDEPVPCVVVIHGLGDRAHAGWLRSLERPARLVMLQAPEPYGPGFSWFDLAPAEQLAPGVAAAAEGVARALAVLVRQRPMRGPPHLMGFSQGGFLTFAVALRHPERVALALPVAGALPRELWPSRRGAGRLPDLVAFHGDADRQVPIAPARGLVAHLRSLGFDAALREFPGVGHRLTPAMERGLVSALDRSFADLPDEPSA